MTGSAVCEDGHVYQVSNYPSSARITARLAALLSICCEDCPHPAGSPMNAHLQDFRVENQDADGPSQYALQRRKIKSRSKGTKKDQGGKNEACK